MHGHQLYSAVLHDGVGAPRCRQSHIIIQMVGDHHACGNVKQFAHPELAHRVSGGRLRPVTAIDTGRRWWSGAVEQIPPLAPEPHCASRGARGGRHRMAKEQEEGEEGEPRDHTESSDGWGGRGRVERPGSGVRAKFLAGTQVVRAPPRTEGGLLRFYLRLYLGSQRLGTQRSRHTC